MSFLHHTNERSSTADKETIVDFTTLPEGPPANHHWARPEALVFLKNLSEVKCADLPQDVIKCSICFVPYDVQDPHEHPVALPWYVVSSPFPILWISCSRSLDVFQEHVDLLSSFPFP